MQFRRIYIKNFQSIKELELILDENKCYHIKGNNNIGKSSFLKALEAVVKNVSSRTVKNFIRDNAESFYIEVSDFDYNVVRLSRGKEDYYSWVIDGVEGRIDNTAGKVPEEVKRYFNLYEDEEKTKEIVNIRPPRAKLLFVDTTFGENYYLLQKALRIEEYLSAIKLGDSKKRELRKEIQIINDRVEDENEELINLSDFAPLLKDVKVYEDAADTYYNQIEEINEVISLNKKVEIKEAELKEKTFDYDREYVAELVSKIKAIQQVIDLANEISEKETKLEIKESAITEFAPSSSMYIKLKESLANKSLLDNVSNLQRKVSTLVKSVEVKEDIINYWESQNVKFMVEAVGSSTDIINVGKSLRNRIVGLKDMENAYDKAEEERKHFMIENKFCPVVLSMKDRMCPFSGKPLEELLTSR